MPDAVQVTRIERLTRDFFHYVLPDEDVHYNHRPVWMTNPRTKQPLELDIFFPRLKLAVEVNGFFHQIDDYQRYKDKKKKKLCHSKGVVLVVITHPKQLLSHEKLRRFKLNYGVIPHSFVQQLMKYKPKKVAEFEEKAKAIRASQRGKSNPNIQVRGKGKNRRMKKGTKHPPLNYWKPKQTFTTHLGHCKGCYRIHLRPGDLPCKRTVTPRIPKPVPKDGWNRI